MLALKLSLNQYEGRTVVLKKDIRPPHFLAGNKCRIRKVQRGSQTSVFADITDGQHSVFCYLSDLL